MKKKKDTPDLPAQITEERFRRMKPGYRGTLLIRSTPPVGPYSSPVPRNL